MLSERMWWRVNSHKVPNYYVLFVLGMLLLGFSSSPGDGVVISYAAPFLLLSCFLFVPVFLNNLSAMDFRFFLWPILFVVVIFLTSFIAAAPMASLSRAITNLLGFFIFLCLIAATMRRRVSVEWTARTLFLSGVVLAGYFILNLMYKSYLHGFQVVILERYVGGAMSLPWGASNTIAQVLLLSVASFLAVKNQTKWDICCLAIIALAIILTFSRSVIILLVCMIYIIIGFRYFSRLVVVGTLIFCGYLYFFNGESKGYETFLSTRLSLANMQTGNGRVETALEKINYFMSHPFEPIGYYSSIYDFKLSAHNYWITTLVEQSLIGVLISLVFFSLIGKMALRASPKIFQGFLIVMMGLMVEDPNFVQPYIIAFWIYFAVIVLRGLESTESKISYDPHQHK